ncbi:hypothetical protein C8T65DRAFT_640988 [Cerioporus squamosus]|nr:hypothetical protein C8T65DRAFT_640988 [Cerioporus squamosus]
MRTCRAFYELGLKALLDRGVVLDSEDTVESFCQFITARNNVGRGAFSSFSSKIATPMPGS